MTGKVKYIVQVNGVFLKDDNKKPRRFGHSELIQLVAALRSTKPNEDMHIFSVRDVK
jgi:hypothetical protein